MKIGAIAGITFKEAKRDRILYLLFFFAALGIVASRVLAILTVGDRIKIIKDVGLASISIFGVLMAILIGTGSSTRRSTRRRSSPSSPSRSTGPSSSWASSSASS